MDPYGDDYSEDTSFRTLAIEADKNHLRIAMSDGAGRLLGWGSAELTPEDPTNPAKTESWALSLALQETLGASDEEDFSGVLTARVTAVNRWNEIAAALRALLPHGRVIAEGIPRAALAATTFGEAGVVVVADEGSVALGRCPQGREVTIGGWGATMGDEGSCPWMVRQAFHALTQAADGRSEPTALTSAFLRHFHASNLMALRQRLDTQPLASDALCAAAHLISHVAREGDAAAQAVLAEAGTELGRLAGAALSRLGMTETPALVGRYGQAFTLGEDLLRAFTEEVRRAAPHAQITPTRVPLIIGTLVLALEDMETPITPSVRSRLEAAGADCR